MLLKLLAWLMAEYDSRAVEVIVLTIIFLIAIIWALSQFGTVEILL
jgi:hypothetical protein